MLTELDGLEDLKGVVVIGATNRPDIIDEALLRPGRFDRLLEVPVPDEESRKEILKIHTSKKPLDHDTVNIDKLVELTDGYTGADIAAMVNAAAMSAIKEHMMTSVNNENEIKEETRAKTREYIKEKEQQKSKLKISMNHFESALQKIKKKNKTTINNQSLV
jgi:transitional endoplasmic reticulum ATPase